MTLLTTTGAAAASLALPDATAWGYGCDPIVFAPDGETAYVVDRAAGVHAIDMGIRSSRCLHSTRSRCGGAVPRDRPRGSRWSISLRRVQPGRLPGVPHRARLGLRRVKALRAV